MFAATAVASFRCPFTAHLIRLGGKTIRGNIEFRQIGRRAHGNPLALHQRERTLARDRGEAHGPRQRQAARLGRPHNGLGQRMFTRLFEACCKPQQILFAGAFDSVDGDH